MKRASEQARAGRWIGAGWGLLGLISLVALGVGPVRTGAGEVVGAVVSGASGGWIDGGVSERVVAVVWGIRMPRLVTGMVVGAGLGMAGACLQGLFRNPLADPGLIGVSSGGAVGAMAGIVVGGGLLAGYPLVEAWQVPLWAMVGAAGTTFMIYRVARIAGRTHVTTLLLAGVAVNALAGAVVGGLIYFSDNDALRQFTFWTLGSLHSSTWGSLAMLGPLVVIPGLILPRYRRALNAFLLGEAEAYHLGFETQRIKRAVILWSAVMVGATVAFCGLIGFVGLVVPHVVRLAVGPDFRRLLPGSAMAGAILLVMADVAARTVHAPTEIPIGVLTSLVGAPFFLYLIQRRKRQLAG